MNEYEFILQDRIAKIQAINAQYDLLNNSYIAFSGGKDSLIVHYLIDLALPNNKIPRVFSNTGLEYIKLVQFVKEMSKNDPRIIILNQTRNIPQTLKEYGYPFKSKEFSLRVNQFNKGSNGKYIDKYLSNDNTSTYFKCPKILRYQFEEKGKYNFSNQCCYKLKKDLQHQWQKENKKYITITGMRKEEGGNRARLSCLTDNGKKFHPIIIVSDGWENDFIRYNEIELCELYNEPYNFKRTGCKGCPFDINIQKTLETMFTLLPNEYKQAINLWKPVYDEYIRLGYRLKYYPHLKRGDK